MGEDTSCTVALLGTRGMIIQVLRPEFSGNLDLGLHQPTDSQFMMRLTRSPTESSEKHVWAVADKHPSYSQGFRA